jgi:flagellar biosynthesis protein FlhF
MQVKRYEVESILEAMSRIKKDLGPDAIVLSTRKIKKGKVEMLEVMAARDENTQPMARCEKPSAPLHYGGAVRDGKVDEMAQILREFKEIRDSIIACQRQNTLAGELAEIRETISSFFDALGMRGRKIPQDVSSKLYLKLLGKGFSRAGACRIVDELRRCGNQDYLKNEAAALSAAAEYIGNTLTVAKKNEPGARIRMFVGPPGVGKTTTLAKLAARVSIGEGKKTGLITVDDCRIAAAEQLGAYARIMGLPLLTASTKESFAKAVEKLSDRDVILVDTPGRALPDDGYLNHLRKAMPGHFIEKNLLINATGNEDYLKNILTGYEHLDPNNLIITKVDESRRCGMLYDMICGAKKPVRYVTFGQNVPQDIDDATPEMMVSLMLDGSMSLAGKRTVYPVLYKERDEGGSGGDVARN